MSNYNIIIKTQTQRIKPVKIIKRTTSYSGHHIRTYLKLNYKMLKFNYFRFGRNKSTGHNNLGRYTVHSKGSNSNYLYLCKQYDLRSLTNYIFILWFYKVTRSTKIYLLAVDMTGALIYIPATNTSSVFNIARACSIYSTNIIKNCYIEQCYKLISNISICYVARYINVMPIFARACGSSCKLLAFKLLNILSIRTIQLPSGKLTRIDSTVPVITGYILPRHKEKYKNTRAGYSSKLGRKPQVRGVVKNPIDHPHGGRARTVSKPRSPWGWYTK